MKNIIANNNNLLLALLLNRLCGDGSILSAIK